MVKNVQDRVHTYLYQGNNEWGTGTAPSESGMKLGMNMSMPRRWNNGRPWCNIVRHADAWRITAGTAVIGQDLTVTSPSVDALLRMDVAANGVGYPDGDYTVRWTGTADIAVGNTSNQTLHSGYSNSGEYTVTLTGNTKTITLWAKNITSITRIEMIIPGALARYDGGNEWAEDFVTMHNSYNSDSIRFMEPFRMNETLIEDWNQRSTSDWNSWASRTSLDNGFASGIKETTVAHCPYDVACSLCNQINVDMWANIPTRASDSFITSMANDIKDNLNSNLNIYLEYSNENWNNGTDFTENTEWVKHEHAPKFKASGTAGSNVFTLNNHGLTSSDSIVTFPSMLNSDVSDPFRKGKAYNISSVTTNTFTVSGASLPTDHVELVYSKGSDTETVSDNIKNKNLDWNHGRRASEIYTIFKTVFGPEAGRLKGVVAGQNKQTNSSTSRRVGVDGANGNFDFFSLAPYFNASSDYSSGDSTGQMYTDSKNAIDDVVAKLAVHLSVLSKPIYCYEGGQSLVSTSVSGSESAMQSFNRSSEMGDLYTYYLQQLADADMFGFNHWYENNEYGSPGYWGLQEYMGQTPDLPKKVAFQAYNGNVEPSV